MALIEFQAQLPFLVARQAIEAHAALMGIVIGRAGDAAQMADVLRGLGRAIEVAVGNGEGPGIAPGDGGGAARFLGAGDFGLDRIAPSAQHRAQTGVKRRLIGFGAGLVALVHREGEAQLGQIGSLDLKAPVDHLAAGGLAQHLGDFVADLGGHRIARQPDEGVEMPFQRRADQRDARARAVDQAHHGQRHTLHIDIGKADHQIMGQAGHGMGQHLARMAIGAEFMLFQQRGELRAHQRHMARRGGQRGAGPYPRMDRERGQLALLDHRQDEQVERHPAVDMRDPVRFDDQRQAARPAPRQKLVEPCKAAGIGGRGEQFPRAFPANAQRAGLRSVAAAHDMAQLRQHSVIEPAQQGRALGPVHRVQGGGIIDHGALDRGPIAHRRAHIAQRDAQRRRNGRARARVRPRGFQIDHRFAGNAGAVILGNLRDLAPPVAQHRHHRMQQPVDHQPVGRNRRGDRIDQKRHVFIDDGDAHETPAPFARDIFDGKRGLRPFPPPSGGQQKARRRDQAIGVQIAVAGQLRLGQMAGQRGFARVDRRGLGKGFGLT